MCVTSLFVFMKLSSWSCVIVTAQKRGDNPAENATMRFASKSHDAETDRFVKIVTSDSLAQQAFQKCAAFPESHNLRILLGFGHFNLSLPADISLDVKF